MSGVARRYARAVMESAREAGGEQAVTALAQGIASFVDLMHDNDELHGVLCSPVFKKERLDVLDATCTRMALDSHSVGLLKLLAERDRLDALHEVRDALDALVSAESNMLHALVQSAIPLDKTQKVRLEAALSAHFGFTVTASIEVAPELLGGLVIQVGDTTLNTSVKRQLEILRERLSSLNA